MKRPCYRDALVWLANNDDCYWLADGLDAQASVSTCLVADMFDVDGAKIANDLRRTLATIHPSHPGAKAVA